MKIIFPLLTIYDEIKQWKIILSTMNNRSMPQLFVFGKFYDDFSTLLFHLERYF